MVLLTRSVLVASQLPAPHRPPTDPTPACSAKSARALRVTAPIDPLGHCSLDTLGDDASRRGLDADTLHSSAPLLAALDRSWDKVARRGASQTCSREGRSERLATPCDTFRAAGPY